MTSLPSIIFTLDPRQRPPQKRIQVPITLLNQSAFERMRLYYEKLVLLTSEMIQRFCTDLFFRVSGSLCYKVFFSYLLNKKKPFRET